MNYYTLANIYIAGICLGFGIMYLFTGLRRHENKRLNLLFAIFALAYSVTLYNGIRYHNATSVEAAVAIIRGSRFHLLAFIVLAWYVAEYTQVKPRIWLWGITTIFIISGIAFTARANLIYDQIHSLANVTMPWGEQVAYLEVTEGVWSLLFLVGQLAILAFMVFACIKQYRRGEHNKAVILSIGVLWFIISIVAEIIGQAGVIPRIFYGEFGFLGFVVAMSLQMANSTIKTDEELATYRLNLEGMVADRTAELEATQAQLLAQAQEVAIVEERGHIARELHDIVTQILFSINLIAIGLPQALKRDPALAERKANELRRLTRGALAEMRMLLRELRPNTIADANLGLLLTQLSQSVSARQDIEVDLQVCSECDLPLEVHVALYRIAQEATTNIAKHAEASQLDMNLDKDDKEVRMIITDDGKGFNIREVPPENMGLNIMQERADAVGAELDIKSQPRAGTTITVTWPIPQAKENTDE